MGKYDKIVAKSTDLILDLVEEEEILEKQTKQFIPYKEFERDYLGLKNINSYTRCYIVNLANQYFHRHGEPIILEKVKGQGINITTGTMAVDRKLNSSVLKIFTQSMTSKEHIKEFIDGEYWHKYAKPQVTNAWMEAISDMVVIFIGKIQTSSLPYKVKKQITKDIIRVTDQPIKQIEYKK